MTVFMKRNLKLYFRDKTAVLSSLLAVFIVIALYVVFLGSSWLNSLPSNLPGRLQLRDSWLAAGLVTVASVTTTLGAFGVMVDDKSKKIIKDFAVSPMRRGAITAGYLLNALIIGSVMSLLVLVLAQGYLVANGGAMLGSVQLLQVLGLVLLSSLCNTAFLCFAVSFFKSMNAFSTISAIVGTLVGFVAGIYLPIGSLPAGVQFGMKLFPISHAALLMRRLMMQGAVATSFADAPPALISEFEEMMGLRFSWGGTVISPLASVCIIVGATVLFYVLAMLNMRRKAA